MKEFNNVSAEELTQVEGGSFISDFLTEVRRAIAVAQVREDVRIATGQQPSP